MIRIARGVRHACRRLLRAPAYAIAAVLTLMLGIGASATVFSLLNAVLLRSLPYADPAQLVDLTHSLALTGISAVDQSDATYLHYRLENEVFTGVAAYQPGAVSLGRLSGAQAGDDARAERVPAARVSASIFGVLRVLPTHGRAFRDDEDHPGAVPVVMIGQRLWERKYAADPGVVGQELEVDGQAREIVGIMPAGFSFPARGTEVWLPVRIDPANTQSAIFDYRAVARLRDAISPKAAAVNLQRLLPRVPEVYAGRLTVAAIEQIKMRAVVRPLRDIIVGDISRALWIVLASVGLVLLIACANVANLFLVRAEGRAQELAVRRALGASTAAIVGEFIYEGLVLASVGGALGIAFAAGGVRVLRSLSAGINIPRLDEVTVDGRALAFTLAITLLAAVLISGLPALRSARLAVSRALADSNRSITVGRGGNRARYVLIVSQVALALMLLAGAGLMARSFATLRSVEPGFEPSGAFTLRIALPDAAYSNPGDAARLLVRALDEIATFPGVTVGAVTKLPLVAEARRDTAAWIEDRPVAPGGIPNIHQVAYASPGYFRALGIPLIEGRTFEAPDPVRARPEVIITRALAERYWSDGHGVGKRVRLMPEGPWFTVVGVTGHVRGTALHDPPDEMIYVPLVSPGVTESAPLWTPHEIAFVVRSAGTQTQIAARVEHVMRALDPAIPVYALRPMREVVEQSTARTYFTLLLVGIAAVVALALGVVGIYGVISYIVSLRTREIAVRLALGARPADVRWMVSRQAVAVAALGIAIGLTGALAMTRFIAALLFGVSPADPATLAGAAVLLLLVALAASWLPAGRAAGVNPADALKA